ncbi:hypothetical protein HID58_050217, partial [Brassica napus]
KRLFGLRHTTMHVHHNWSSNWSPFGSITKYLRGESSRNTGIPTAATLAELWDQGTWQLLPARSEASIYCIWAERNARLHRSRFRPPSAIVKEIHTIVKLRIASIRIDDPHLASVLFQAWVS